MITTSSKRSTGYLPSWILLGVFLTMSSALNSEDKCINPEVRIPDGKIVGEIYKTRNGRDVYSFRSIPYAEPPVGRLRFAEPLPARSWNNTLLAITEAPICPQLSNGVFKGNEDCLYLNVYTPELRLLNDSTLLPVMVFIHSGGFESGNGGSTLYGPRFILDKDVVLVTINYRLGPLGFLSTGDEVVPGNNGLKDLVLALKWVKRSIEYFSGDPDRVTIFGQSVGGAAVHLLALSGLTDGLFNQCIVQSGSAFSIRGYRPRNVYKERAFELAGYLGCRSDNSSSSSSSSRLLVDCLKQVDAKKIVETRPLFNLWKKYPDLVWGPTDEPEIDGAFITESPRSIYANGKVLDLPLIIGDVENGGLMISGDLYTNPDDFETLLANIDQLLPVLLQYDKYLSDVQARTDALKAYYFGGGLSGDRRALLSNLTDLLSDSFFIYPIFDVVNRQLGLIESPAYFYRFEYRGRFSNSYRFVRNSNEDFGSTHSDDIMYLFPQTQERFGKPETDMTDDDFTIVDTMVQLWTSFAIHGTPRVSSLNDTLTWKRYSSMKNYLRIGNHSEVTLSNRNNFLSERMQFWKELTAGDNF